MSSHASNYGHDSSSKKHSSKSKSKSKAKNDDWTEVTEPEERRRIQNRIAQRKFRKCSGSLAPPHLPLRPLLLRDLVENQHH
jgi:hypothetical protein